MQKNTAILLGLVIVLFLITVTHKSGMLERHHNWRQQFAHHIMRHHDQFDDTNKNMFYVSDSQVIVTDGTLSQSTSLHYEENDQTVSISYKQGDPSNSSVQIGIGGDSSPSELNDPDKGILLGASTSWTDPDATTMADTGTFEDNMMNLLGIFGMLLIMAGYKSYASQKKAR